MNRTRLLVSTIGVLIVLIVGLAWFVNTHRSLSIDYGPVPKDPPMLTKPDLETLLADHYTVARHVRQIPGTLRESFTNLTGLPFDMNDPGEPMSTDAIIHAPSRQLIFAAVGRQSAIVVYEQGSFASFPCAAVFSRSGAAAWIAIDDYQPTDIAALRKTVHGARYKPMKPTA